MLRLCWKIHIKAECILNDHSFRKSPFPCSVLIKVELKVEKMMSQFRGSSYTLTVVTVVNVVMMLLLSVSSSQGSHIMEIILEEEPPSVGAATLRGTAAGQPPLSSPPRSSGILEFEENAGGGGNVNANPVSNTQCNIEFQVMKVFPGHCMRLGRNGGGRGCVSGNHIIPFHPDCM